MGNHMTNARDLSRKCSKWQFYSLYWWWHHNGNQFESNKIQEIIWLLQGIYPCWKHKKGKTFSIYRWSHHYANQSNSVSNILEIMWFVLGAFHVCKTWRGNPLDPMWYNASSSMCQSLLSRWPRPLSLFLLATDGAVGVVTWQADCSMASCSTHCNGKLPFPFPDGKKCPLHTPGKKWIFLARDASHYTHLVCVRCGWDVCLNDMCKPVSLHLYEDYRKCAG